MVAMHGQINKRAYLAQVSLERRNADLAKQWVFFFVVLRQSVEQTQQVQLAFVKVHVVQNIPTREQ